MSAKQPRQQRRKNIPLPNITKSGDPRAIDLLFIHDCTASQTPYISATVRRCSEMIEVIRDLGKLKSDKGMRVGLIAFRDHHEWEEFVTRDFGGFTHDTEKIISDLKSLVADGGEDYPEAVTAALARSLELDWRDDAAKLVVLVTDASPHGIGEDDDDYKQGDPNGYDPLELARKMANRGITMLVVACEPMLSNVNAYAHDFYAALTKITNGRMVPLLDMRVLSPLIICTALEQLGLDELARDYKDSILELHKGGSSLKEVIDTVWRWLSKREKKVFTLQMNQIYQEPPEFEKIVEEWANAKNISSVREKIWKMTTVGARVPAQYLEPDTGWPRTKVDITLKNLGDDIIDYKYHDPHPDIDPNVDSDEVAGSLGPSKIEPPRKLLAHTDYYFKFKSGSKSTGLIKENFKRQQDLDASRHFK